MFVNLYDEGNNLYARIAAFKKEADQMLASYGGNYTNHHQDEHAITTYLWLKYPDKYYIYYFEIVQKTSEILRPADGSRYDYEFKKGAYEKNIRNYVRLYDEICAQISSDANLTAIVDEGLQKTGCEDKNYHTLTYDVSFYLKKFYSEGMTAKEYYMQKGQAGNAQTTFDEDDAQDEDIESDVQGGGVRCAKWMEPILQTLINLGGNATRSNVHAEIIHDYDISKEELQERHESGSVKVLNDIDWARLYLVKEGFLSNQTHGVWELTDIGRKYKVTDELAGQIVKKWVKIDSAKRGQQEIPEIDLIPFYVLRCEKYDKQKFLNEVFMGSDLSNPNPSDSDAASKRYEDLANLVEDKYNVILTGAPGVGKTFAARRLAYSLMGEKDDDRIEMVQFHQNYSYEDFVLGYKPTKNGGFELRKGLFYRFCQRALSQPEDKHFYFIIDEINRGNMSRIFGELLMMIEKDYRGKEIKLAYGNDTLIVPKNIRIIGMMNTADRSLAMIDYALRRRFSFFEMEPAFKSTGFVNYQKETVNNPSFNKLIETMVELNEAIADDSTLGKGFCIGHSYFSEWEKKDCLNEETLLNKIQRVVKYDILPILEEYWFDEPNTVKEWRSKFFKVVGISGGL